METKRNKINIISKLEWYFGFRFFFFFGKNKTVFTLNVLHTMYYCIHVLIHNRVDKDFTKEHQP